VPNQTDLLLVILKLNFPIVIGHDD
jgi:hypothetical protein